MTCSAIILNGGGARRMAGVDKAWLEVAGQPIVLRQLEVLRQRFTDLAMVRGERQAKPQSMDLPIDLPMLGDRVGGLGPLDGIASGLAWCAHDWLLVVAGDMPFVNLEAIDTLLGQRRSDIDIVAANIDSRAQPLLALYNRRILPVLDQELANRRLRASAFLCKPPAGVRVAWLREDDFSQEALRAFDNLNTPEDLKELVPIEPQIE
ncbi:MAG: molybdenum cofactor guanylyltransferase [Kofleriaceae bacterium]|nr:molybdenum cofactor guanylyltransferase [Kofleriaceae bacterium]